jgi:hypothetical protein
MAKFLVPTQHMYGVMYRDMEDRGYSGFGWTTHLFDTEIDRDAMIKDIAENQFVWGEGVPVLRIEVDVPITVVEQYDHDQEAVNTQYGD